MLKHQKRALIACIILLVSFSVSGQYRKKRNQFLEGFKIQPKAGINMFYGDLVSEGRTNYVFGVAAEKEVMPYLNVRLDVNYGSMKGTQLLPSTNDPYAYFENSFIGFNAGVTFRPIDLFYGLFKQRYFNPYAIGQIGMMSFNADEYFGDSGEPGYENTLWRNVTGMTPTFSLGGGLNVYYNSHISFTAEFIASKAFSDQLDGHDVWYMNYNQPNQVEVETDAGDFFYVATIGVTYLFDDSQWKNSPKYNRKAYLRTRSIYKNNKNKYRRPTKRKTKRYKSR